MKNIIICFALLFVVGCGDGISWIPDSRIETEEERKCVEKIQTELLKHIPTTLSGHDQDWDDVISTTDRVAVNTCCKVRLYEFENKFFGRTGYTGKMKEIK
jgi:hypothetical protein